MTTELVIPPESTPGVAVPFRNKEVVLNGQDRYAGDSAIQDAENDASTGDIIAIGPGTYQDTVTVTTDEITLFGSGTATVVDGQSNGPALTFDDCPDVRVMNLAVQTDSSSSHNAWEDASTTGGSGPNQLSAEGIVVNSAGNQGVNVTTGNDTLLRDVHVKSTNGGHGIQLSQLGATAIACMVDSAGDNGINANVLKGKVIGCIVVDATTHGIELQSSQAQESIVGFNKIDNSGSDGIHDAGTDNIIVGNQALSSTNQNIDLSNATDPIAAGNNPPTTRLGQTRPTVRRDASGSVQFTSAGSASTNRTATGTATSQTTTTRDGNYTQLTLTLTGTFTTATATASLNGAQRTTITTTGGTATTTTTTNTTSPTWTVGVNLQAGTNATANLSPSINQTTTVNRP